MKLYHFMCVSVLLALIMLVPVSADAVLVFGSTARSSFEFDQQKRLTAFVDFEDYSVGLYSELPDLPVKLWTDEFRWPLPVSPAPSKTRVALLPCCGIKSPLNNRLMGVREGDTPDGQSKYIIYFNKCQSRVGLMRNWNTFSITRFFSESKLLAQHRNTTDRQFVGYMGANEKDCVKFVEIDGLPSDPEDTNNDKNYLYQVGEVDDLFLSTPLLTILTNFPTNQNPTEIFEVVHGQLFDISIQLKSISFDDYKQIAVESVIFDSSQKVFFKHYEYCQLVTKGVQDIRNFSIYTSKIPLGLYTVRSRIFYRGKRLPGSPDYSRQFRVLGSKKTVINAILPLLLNPGDSD